MEAPEQSIIWHANWMGNTLCTTKKKSELVHQNRKNDERKNTRHSHKENSSFQPVDFRLAQTPSRALRSPEIVRLWSSARFHFRFINEKCWKQQWNTSFIDHMDARAHKACSNFTAPLLATLLLLKKKKKKTSYTTNLIFKRTTLLVCYLFNRESRPPIKNKYNPLGSTDWLLAHVDHIYGRLIWAWSCGAP